jgi:manganese transport protein
MAGFINIRVPVLVRRAVTLIPALVILALGVSTTGALVLSQVVLSFGIPFALVPLVPLTGRRDVMGAHANGRLMSLVAYGTAAAITAMNVFLIASELRG